MTHIYLNDLLIKIINITKLYNTVNYAKVIKNHSMSKNIRKHNHIHMSIGTLQVIDLNIINVLNSINIYILEHNIMLMVYAFHVVQISIH